MLGHRGEVIISGIPNVSCLIEGFMKSGNPDVQYITVEDPEAATDYLVHNYGWVVGAVGLLARKGLFERAEYSLTPFLDRLINDPQFALTSVGIVSRANCATVDEVVRRYPRIELGASLCHLNTAALAAWAKTL